jgi:L-amino acid N-acyltransferase YncA
MNVRSLAWADFPHLTEVYYSLYDEVRENPNLGVTLFASPPTLSEETDWFARLFRRVLDGNAVALVAEEEGRAVALCTVDRKGPSPEVGHIGVVGIMVGAAWRRRGIGKALLQQVIVECKGRFDLLELTVFSSNGGAIVLYRSLGFTTWGTLPKGVRRNGTYTDVEHMFLVLSATQPA